MLRFALLASGQIDRLALSFWPLAGMHDVHLCSDRSQRHKMLRNAAAAIGYFVIVFSIGFLLGALRMLVVAPQLGEQLALLIELPVMLALSWIACSWIIKRFAVLRALTARFFIGGLAFALLMAAELGLSVFGFKRTIVEHFETYRAAPAIFGLLAQIVFALFPVIQLWGGLRHTGHK
jgi:hypothetical protein